MSVINTLKNALVYPPTHLIFILAILISLPISANELNNDVNDEIRKNNLTSKKIVPFLKNEFEKLLEGQERALSYKESALNIYFVCGINGAGKTTDTHDLDMWTINEQI